MNFLKKQMNGKVGLGAKIYAALLIVYNGMAFASYYNILRSPDILRQVGETNPALKMTEEQIAGILAELPLQLAMVGIVMFGLLLLILNQRWGFILFAASPTVNAVSSMLGGDLLGGLSALLPVVLMALILWLGPSRGRRRNDKDPGVNAG